MRESMIVHILENVFWLTSSVQSCPCDWAFQHAKTFDCFWPFCLNVRPYKISKPIEKISRFAITQLHAMAIQVA